MLNLSMTKILYMQQFIGKSRIFYSDYIKFVILVIF